MIEVLGAKSMGPGKLKAAERYEFFGHKSSIVIIGRLAERP